MAEEESFPRGGNVAAKRPPNRDNDTLFNVAKPPKAKRAKKSKQADESSNAADDLPMTLNLKGTLDYSKIQCGMTILGCIRRITNLALEIELPGLCFALVPITHISESLNQYLGERLEQNDLETGLKDLFVVGEFLPIKIVDVTSNDDVTRIEASTNPAHLYADRHFNSFGKGHVVWATPINKSDHGYEMSVGVRDVRAFLPFKNTEPGADLAIGKPVWCVVHKFEATPTSSLMRLSAKVDHVRACHSDIDNVDVIIPGTRVEFAVVRVSEHGIYGKIGAAFTAYVDENYLARPLNKMADYQDRTVLKGYVLYVAPVTKVVYVTLRHPDTQSTPGLANGDVVRAMVHSKATNGMFFLLADVSVKGFATNKRLLASLNARDKQLTDDDLTTALAVKYQAGAEHTCRVLDYNRLTMTYVVTPEASAVNERTYATRDLSVGQAVKVRARAVKTEGVVVACGRVNGFVPNLHLSNALYTSAIKRKFAEGQQLDARVLVIDQDKVLFTLKSQLVTNDACLTSVETARVGAKYPGVVAKSTPSGVLIVFYGNVKGWLDGRGMPGHVTDPENYFFIGQVVDVYIVKVNGGQLTLSLFAPPPEVDKMAGPHVGGRYSATVRAIQDGGVDVTIDGSGLTGFVPDAHLSDTVSICRAVKETLCPGDRLVNLLYVGGTDPSIYSRREGIEYSSRKVPIMAEVRVGDLLRCSYQKRKKNKIYVRPLIQDFVESVPVPKENFDATLPDDLLEHQLLLARVTQVEPSIALSIKLNDVYDGTVESTLRMYSRHFVETAFVYRSGRKRKWPICRFGLGERVEGRVQVVGEKGGCVIHLSQDGARAIAAPALCPASIKVGDHVTGTVIGHDFARRYVDVCLTRALCRRMENGEGAGGGDDAEAATALPAGAATKLLVKDDYVICLSSARAQLVNLPRRLHVNDFVGCDAYYDRKKFKICVCGKIKSYWLGMSRNLFLRLDRSAGGRKRLVKEKQKNEDDSAPVHEPAADSGISDDEEAETVETSTKTVVLPDVSTFFHPQTGGDLTTTPADESSDDDDTTDGDVAREKRKKLSAGERALALRREEERIGNIEKELADATATPQSAEQFDRLLLSKPDSAELWAKYVAFHVAGTEIDKARAVARRALSTIAMTLTEEKLKMWLVLLNLENLFGTRATFDACLSDALTRNDPLRVYVKTIEMLSRDVAKLPEMDALIAKVQAKYKRELSMWCDVAACYYRLGRVKEARDWRARALKSIVDKKSQMTLIVRFAIMEFQYGDADEAAAIFETIVRADAKKTHVWMTYVDQLIKRGRVDEARDALDRALAQKLPLRSARALFMKRRRLEETHGTRDTVEAVKAQAQRYIDRYHRDDDQNNEKEL